MGNDILDITLIELEEYRKKVTLCEICNNEEVAISSIYRKKVNRLSVDHCHTTNKFRGLLCFKCNIQLGWYEKNSEAIANYLK